MNETTNRPAWATAAILIGRLVFTAMFLMAVSAKLMNINGTAGQIAAAGFPLSGILVWLVVVFELAVIAGFLTGAYFRAAALLAAVYVVFSRSDFMDPRIGPPAKTSSASSLITLRSPRACCSPPRAGPDACTRVVGSPSP